MQTRDFSLRYHTRQANIDLGSVYYLVDPAPGTPRTTITALPIGAAAPTGRALVDVAVDPLGRDDVLSGVRPDAVAADGQLLAAAVALAPIVAAGALVEEGGGGRDVALLDEGHHTSVGGLIGEGDGLGVEGEEDDGEGGGEAHGECGLLIYLAVLDVDADERAQRSYVMDSLKSQGFCYSELEMRRWVLHELEPSLICTNQSLRVHPFPLGKTLVER